MYLVFVGPALLFAAWASFRVHSAFQYYSSVPTATGYSGAQAAQTLLEHAGIYDVRVVPTSGFLSDHYDPVSKELALSQDVYYNRSVAAVGVATHEAGHAIQHARHYAPLWVRSALVPTANIGSNLGLFILAFGAM